MFTNTRFRQSAHYNIMIVGIMKQNKIGPDGYQPANLLNRACPRKHSRPLLFKVPTFLQMMVDALDKGCDEWEFVFLSFLQFRTQSTKYLQIACRIAGVMSLVLIFCHVMRNFLKPLSSFFDVFAFLVFFFPESTILPRCRSIKHIYQLPSLFWTTNQPHSRRESWRHLPICRSQEWHAETTPRGFRM